LKSKIKYLGFLISENAIRADNRDVEAVKNFPVPSKVQPVVYWDFIFSKVYKRFLYNSKTVNDFNLAKKR